MFHQEALVWKQLRHKNIVKFIGIQRLSEGSEARIGIVAVMMEHTLNQHVRNSEYNPHAEGEKLVCH